MNITKTKALRIGYAVLFAIAILLVFFSTALDGPVATQHNYNEYSDQFSSQADYRKALNSGGGGFNKLIDQRETGEKDIYSSKRIVYTGFSPAGNKGYVTTIRPFFVTATSKYDAESGNKTYIVNRNLETIPLQKFNGKQFTQSEIHFSGETAYYYIRQKRVTKGTTKQIDLGESQWCSGGGRRGIVNATKVAKTTAIETNTFDTLSYSQTILGLLERFFLLDVTETGISSYEVTVKEGQHRVILNGETYVVVVQNSSGEIRIADNNLQHANISVNAKVFETTDTPIRFTNLFSTEELHIEYSQNVSNRNISGQSNISDKTQRVIQSNPCP